MQQTKIDVAATMMTSLAVRLCREVQMITGASKRTAMRGLKSPRAILIVDDRENM
jgi:hypothetical protein